MGPALSRLAAVRADVDRYYSAQLARYGATPMGVAWTCVPTQQLRFIQLAKVFDWRKPLSVNDIGCGYGALLAFLRQRHRGTPIDYLGIDLSQPMVDAARRRWRATPGVCFALAGKAHRSADYCVASGIFNVKLGHELATWEAFIAETLAEMFSSSRLGMAVNFMREDSGLDDIPEIYRCLPDKWMAYCRQLGAAVEILDNYGMSEFTLLLRRH